MKYNNYYLFRKNKIIKDLMFFFLSLTPVAIQTAINQYSDQISVFKY